MSKQPFDYHNALTEALEGVEIALERGVGDISYADTVCRQLKRLLKRAERLRDGLASEEHPGQGSLWSGSEESSNARSENPGEPGQHAKG